MTKRTARRTASKIKTRTNTKHPPISKSAFAALKKISAEGLATLLARSAEEDTQRNLRHSNAFRDLETPIHNLYCMAEISADLLTGVSEDRDELAHFAIFRVCEMVRDLKAKHLAGLDAGPSRGKAGQS
jgi:hypothetical protein